MVYHRVYIGVQGGYVQGGLPTRVYREAYTQGGTREAYSPVSPVTSWFKAGFGPFPLSVTPGLRRVLALSLSSHPLV